MEMAMIIDLEGEATVQYFERMLRWFIRSKPWVFRTNQEICDVLNFAAILVGAQVHFSSDEEHLQIQIHDDDYMYLPLILRIFKRSYERWGDGDPPALAP